MYPCVYVQIYFQIIFYYMINLNDNTRNFYDARG